MNVACLLARTARSAPQRPAVFHGARCLFNYGELAARSARIAGWLRHKAGLAPGERVAIFLGNCPEYLEVLYGAWWAGQPHLFIIAA